jgi:hypothetical protein
MSLILHVSEYWSCAGCGRVVSEQSAHSFSQARGGEEMRGSWWYALYRSHIFLAHRCVVRFGLEKRLVRGGKEEEEEERDVLSVVWWVRGTGVLVVLYEELAHCQGEDLLCVVIRARVSIIYYIAGSLRHER